MPRVWGAIKGEEVVFLDTSAVTSVAQKLLEEQRIEGFEGFEVIRREVPFQSSRFDFLLGRGSERLFLEVKSCTLFFDGLAMFPDAVTVRGRKHVELLGNLHGTVLFVVHSPSCFAFLPDFHTDPGFAKALYTFREQIRIRVVAVRWHENGGFEYIRSLAIPWRLYEEEAQDRGSYILSGYLREDTCIPVGNLGKRYFPKGFYLYVGSAMQSLSRRVQRHLRKRKKEHWHIDFLLPFFEGLRVFEVRSSERLECAIAEELEKIAQVIPSFGASDCSCSGHLFFTPKPPLQSEAFVDVLLHFRIGRIARKLKDC